MNLFSAGCCIANRCCNTLEFAWQNVTHHKSGLSNSHPRHRTAYHSLWMENFENLRVMPVLGIVRLCNLYNKSSTWVCLSAHVSPDLWSCYEWTMAIVYHKKPQKVIVIPCKTVMRWQRKGLVVCMYYGQVLLRVLHSWIWWSMYSERPHSTRTIFKLVPITLTVMKQFDWTLFTDCISECCPTRHVRLEGKCISKVKSSSAWWYINSCCTLLFLASFIPWKKDHAMLHLNNFSSVLHTHIYLPKQKIRR